MSGNDSFTIIDIVLCLTTPRAMSDGIDSDRTGAMRSSTPKGSYDMADWDDAVH